MHLPRLRAKYRFSVRVYSRGKDAMVISTHCKATTSESSKVTMVIRVVFKESLALPYLAMLHAEVHFLVGARGVSPRKAQNIANSFTP